MSENKKSIFSYITDQNIIQNNTFTPYILNNAYLHVKKTDIDIDSDMKNLFYINTRCSSKKYQHIDYKKFI